MVKGLAEAEDGQRHVGEVDEVARGADAAAFGDIGGDAGVEHVAHLGEQRDAHSGIAFDQGVEAHRHGGPGQARRERRAEAGGVADDEVVLQGLDAGVVDDLVAHRPIGGVDAIDDLALGHRPLEHLARALAAEKGLGVEGDGSGALADGDDVFGGERLAAEDGFLTLGIGVHRRWMRRLGERADGERLPSQWWPPIPRRRRTRPGWPGSAARSGWCFPSSCARRSAAAR